MTGSWSFDEMCKKSSTTDYSLLSNQTPNSYVYVTLYVYPRKFEAGQIGFFGRVADNLYNKYLDAGEWKAGETYYYR